MSRPILKFIVGEYINELYIDDVKVGYYGTSFYLDKLAGLFDLEYLTNSSNDVLIEVKETAVLEQSKVCKESVIND